MVDIDRLCVDLHEEHASLDTIVVSLPDEAWDEATPAPGWSVRDQISHLAFFDELALLAVSDRDAFSAKLQRAAEDVDEFMNAPLRAGRSIAPHEVLNWWRTARTDMLKAFWSTRSDERIPWVGPPMSLASFITARLMETWAHGQDVADALGAEREPTDRLKHICHLGVRTRRNSYAVRGLEVPTGDVLVELSAPSGEKWVWGEESPDRIAGPALDFCLVVTQRRHLADTSLEVEGPLATEWIEIAQAFAGPPGPGRKPGQFSDGSS
jgi:uncharacterized protein (TIGR03084 family)